MTTVIAKKNANGSVTIGFDSQVTPSNGTVQKVTDVNGQFVLGVSGYLRYLDILQYTDVPKVHEAELESEDFDARGYLITNVIPAWIKVLKDSFQDIPDTREDWMGGSVLLVICGRIFTIGQEFSVVEHEEYAGIGSGSAYALGALAAGKNVQKALEIAASLDVYTGGTLSIAKVER